MTSQHVFEGFDLFVPVALHVGQQLRSFVVDAAVGSKLPMRQSAACYGG